MNAHELLMTCETPRSKIFGGLFVAVQNPVATHSVGKTFLRRLWLWLFVLLASLRNLGIFRTR